MIIMIRTYIKQILNGVSQIMLQENIYTALLFIAGLLAGSWQCALAVVAGSAIGALAARILNYDKAETDIGLYGFSPSLVGAALAFMYEQSFVLWIFIIIGSVLAAVVQHFFIARKIPAYTFPFILVTWILVLVINAFFGLNVSMLIAETPDYGVFSGLIGVSNGFGEVIFQGAALSGILFFVGVMVSNPIAGVYALAASWLGGMAALWVGQPVDAVNMGLYGFNVVLTAIVFAGNSKIDALWTAIGVVITIVVHVVLVNSQLLGVVGGVFTFPFVVGTWITLWMRKYIRL